MRRLALLASVLLPACVSAEAPRVELAVVVDGSGVEPITTDLGWSVALQEARVAIRDVRFTTAGEIHERAPEPGAWLLGLLLPSAHAHPGHFQGGEIIGELPGEFVLDFVGQDRAELGIATLIVGEYTAANFVFRRADELDDGDPLRGHTAYLAGTAEQDGALVEFRVTIDSPIDRELIGAPFTAEVGEDSEFDLGLRLLTRDQQEFDTLFDGLDFAALDAADGAADGLVELRDPELDPDLPAALQDAYNELRRTLQTHDHFDVTTSEP